MTTTADHTTDFFEELRRRGNEPLLRQVSGSVRFDIVDLDRTESWLVTVDKGEVGVARNAGAGECTIRADREVFDQVVDGRANALAAVLRGAFTCHGDLELLFAIQRIFPAPPRGWDPTAATRSAQ